MYVPYASVHMYKLQAEVSLNKAKENKSFVTEILLKISRWMGNMRSGKLSRVSLQS